MNDNDLLSEMAQMLKPGHLDSTKFNKAVKEKCSTGDSKIFEFIADNYSS
jgi:hypothetical protein